MWDSLRQRFRSTLRFKLLVLVWLPLSVAMAATLGYTLFRFHTFTQETLQFAVRDDLATARQALRQAQNDFLLELQQLAESAEFQAQLRRGNRTEVQRALRRARDAKGFSFLHLTGVAGNWLHEADGTSKPSPLTDRAARGVPGAALEVFRPENLRRESIALAAQARPEQHGGEQRGLVLRVAQPILDDRGRVAAILDGGVLLNRNTAVLEAMFNRIYASDALPGGAQPFLALLLDQTRIAAAPATLGATIGEQLTPELRTLVAQGGETWIGSSTVGDAGYIVGFGALYDVDNQRVGTLQVGMRENAFSAGYYRTAGLFLLLFFAAAGIAAWIAARGVRAVVEPVERMAGVARATAAGHDQRIGPIAARDEVGALARQFDFMLDQLAARKQEIERNAEALELKVGERTQELALKNAELEATISLLRHTREQLVLAEKLSALGQMAAGIAHEINNPAAVILGNLDVLTAELGEHARPVTREIELIGQQVERIRHIVTSLLQFARARPGEGPVVDVEVNRLVEDVQPLVAHMLKARNLGWHCRLEATGTVAANPFDLEQVLINLIGNAANACEDGGHIVVTTADWDGGSTISVIDDGSGIAPDDLKRIFDPFFTTNLQHGVGLGLSVSYGLVHRYGGHITVDTTVGEGSVFRVWLLRQPEIPEQAGDTTITTQRQEMHYG
jgi:two-component system NtrC family sensor kinase